LKRRLTAVFLILALALGSVPALAASTMDNFKPVRTYGGHFTDVPAGEWYAGYISRLYELGLTEGRSATTFGPAGNVKVGEVITFAARIRSMYTTGTPEAGPAAYTPQAHWSDPYADYLQSLGALGTEFDAVLEQPATRAQSAGILAHALPAEILSPRNTQVVTEAYAMGRCITDVTAHTPYQADILSLYRWGILEGMDEIGSFYPDQPIRRREVAAMLVRLVDESQRLTILWDLGEVDYSAAGTTLPSLVKSDGISHTTHALTDMTAIDRNIRWMLSRDEHMISLTFGPGIITADTASQLMDRYLKVIRYYIEQSYNAVSCTYRPSSGTVEFTFYSGIFSNSALPTARNATMDYAIALHDRLWQEGAITSAMTETEKARVYFTWLAENSAYDFSATSSSPSHTAYGLFQQGLAVCDGYTAAYNLLLKLEGISCTTYSKGDHIWTVATLDGKTVHSDVTWGDQVDHVAYQYFAMTEAEALNRKL